MRSKTGLKEAAIARQKRMFEQNDDPEADERGLGVYSGRLSANTFNLKEIRDTIPHLISNAGHTILSAMETAEFTSPTRYYHMMNGKGLTGIRAMLELLESIGYSVEILVKVDRGKNTKKRLRRLHGSVNHKKVTGDQHLRRQSVQERLEGKAIHNDFWTSRGGENNGGSQTSEGANA